MRLMMMVFLASGGSLCCLNFYLSFVRYPVYRMMGGKKEEYRWVSGIPLLGSLFVAISLVVLWQSPWLVALAIVLILMDTGGLPWFAGTMLYDEVFRKQSSEANDSTAPSKRNPSDVC